MVVDVMPCSNNSFNLTLVGITDVLNPIYFLLIEGHVFVQVKLKLKLGY